jgi:uncharacterized membrane protein YcaP (DUF421 family)
MAEILQILFTSATSFITLFIIAKLMGKKQISELSFVDYVVGISIGSISAAMAVDSETPFYHFLIAMAIYLLFDYIISLLSIKSIVMKNFLRGAPVLLIYDGRLQYENLKKSMLDINEFLALCREKNFFDINDIAYCVYETNGGISILPKSHASPILAGDMNLAGKRPALSIDFIIDGQIMDKALKQAGKKREWLLEKLKNKNVKVEDVALANYVKQKDDIVVYFKKNN